MLKPTQITTILSMYSSASYTTESIAAKFGVTPRSIQRLANKHGVIRTQAESNKAMAHLKNYRTIPIELRVKRKQLTLKKRYQVINTHPFCSTCGLRADDGVRLEVDHIDENPENNIDSNLQVLCNRCNLGKSHLARF